MDASVFIIRSVEIYRRKISVPRILPLDLDTTLHFTLHALHTILNVQCAALEDKVKMKARK
jgi:hypothetical protein